MKIVHWIVIGAGLLLLAVPVALLYYPYVANPRVTRELMDDPDGERSRKVMLVTLPSGRQLPVNYLREGDRVYAGADGRWWKELVGEGHPVTLVIRGQTLTGSGRAVLDDPARTKDVFSRLRPVALPSFGTLVEVRLGGDS